MNEGSASAREQLLSTLADQIRALRGPRRLVAVDGVDGSGKTTFAISLADELQESGESVVLIHADNFLNLKSVRHRQGRDSPVGFYEDSYDYRALRINVLEPLGPSGSGRFMRRFSDIDLDVEVEPIFEVAVLGTICIVEGMFLHRPQLVEYWDYSIFLDVPFDETARRMSIRDGSSADPEHTSMQRYVGGQRLYFADAQPWLHSTRVVDNSDPRRPKVIERFRKIALK